VGGACQWWEKLGVPKAQRGHGLQRKTTKRTHKRETSVNRDEFGCPWGLGIAQQEKKFVVLPETPKQKKKKKKKKKKPRIHTKGRKKVKKGNDQSTRGNPKQQITGNTGN